MVRSMEAVENQQDPSRATLGVVEGIVAYLWWGIITTLYFRWMKRTDPLELVAWRVLGGLPVMLVVVQIRGELPLLRKILRDRRAVFALFISGLLILLNWLTFIFAVLNERITEASLGYYINPLVSVALGAIFLGEKLRPLQWLAVSLAGVAVMLLALTTGSLPWISLVLAFSFGGYGLVRKQVKAESEVGLCIEMLLLLLPMLALQVWLTASDRTIFLTDAPLTWGLLIGGVVTVVPLILFSRSARKLRLATVGLLQYIAPTAQLCVAVWLVGEVIGDRWPALILIGLAVLLYSFDSIRAHRNRS
ncbi:MAG: EamA family transporter RarD [Planctomycetes bacterium]|jgi:chloramphenicol-sensitive protein RarD|nr:EamA family transporter RarD [Planctomycetota bacterium]MBT6540710.1 EamA family transporter RarD [Planctomycetota bacterium]MBT6785309.1 EamA family transporter RarD [Planctomycetota bacterium]MBT7640134.1 EamA family transporter RarD [Planctomycetota bacterium]